MRVKNFSTEEIAIQFYLSESCQYFQNAICINLLKKVIIKLSSSFRNFTKQSMELKRLISVINNIVSSAVNNEMKIGPEYEKALVSCDQFIKYLMYEMFHSGIFKSKFNIYQVDIDFFLFENLKKLTKVKLIKEEK